jgi:diamine N-acetyltransferase
LRATPSPRREIESLKRGGRRKAVKPRPVVHVRPAQDDDYEGIGAVLAEADFLHSTTLPDVFRQPDVPGRSREYIAELIDSPDSALIVADCESRIVGAAVAKVIEAPALPVMVPRRLVVVSDVVVLKDYRRCGIGRALMERIERWAGEQGASHVELSVYEFNKPAISFYRKLGFRTASRRLRKTLT